MYLHNWILIRKKWSPLNFRGWLAAKEHLSFPSMSPNGFAKIWPGKIRQRTPAAIIIFFRLVPDGILIFLHAGKEK